MADEDLDLEDDDLDLGDEGGDDFAGELDDMMGDDELGGDSDGGGDDSDGELDSFFEDLSSIEDMDEGASDSSDEADFDDSDDEDEVAPDPKKAKEKKKAVPASDQKGGKLKYFIFLLLLIGAGGGGYLYLDKNVGIPLEDRTVPVETFKTEEIFQIEKKPIKQERKVEPVIETMPAEPPPPPRKKVPTKRYLVQVATCSYEVCKEDYISSLRRDGEPVYQRSSGQKYDYIELVSKQVYSYSKASFIVKEINLKNKMAGNAFIVFQSNGHRISMGTFPALDRAKSVKFSVEGLFPRKDVKFNLEHVRKDYSTTKIFAGPYDSRIVAKRALKGLRSKEKYKGSFLVRY